MNRDSKESKASIQARNDGDDELAIEIEAKRLLRRYRVSKYLDKSLCYIYMLLSSQRRTYISK